jgi:Zn-dependent peptidase ImmA (M78 family)
MHPDANLLLIRAVDLVIADVEQRNDDADRAEALTVLHELRHALLNERA